MLWCWLKSINLQKVIHKRWELLWTFFWQNTALAQLFASKLQSLCLFIVLLSIYPWFNWCCHQNWYLLIFTSYWSFFDNRDILITRCIQNQLLNHFSLGILVFQPLFELGNNLLLVHLEHQKKPLLLKYYFQICQCHKLYGPD